MQPPKIDTDIKTKDWSEVSSQVESTTYYTATKDLVVTFKGTGRYIYRNVPLEVYENMEKAESIGKFLNQHIKSKYEYAKG